MLLELLPLLKITNINTHTEHFTLVEYYTYSLWFYIKLKIYKHIHILLVSPKTNIMKSSLYRMKSSYCLCSNSI